MITMSKAVILTGLRANGEFHLGNYLGAIRPIIELQHNHAGQYKVNMFIPDLHSFTTPIDHGTLYQQTVNNLKMFVAAGLDIGDPDTYVYRQSYIPAHSELTWILSCFAYYGELARMTQFKEKARELTSNESDEKNVAGTSAGLFIYPVLMAADILLYGAQYVPVGEDQRQHLELTRDIAIRMNNRFGNLFVVPHEWAKQLEFTKLDKGIRIRSLRNPEKKMSKSIDDPAGTIMLSDSPEEAAKKVKGATTDGVGSIHFDWEKQPGVTNLLQMLSLLSGQSQTVVNKAWEGRAAYSDLKSTVSEVVKNFIEEIQAKLNQVDEKSLMSKLQADETKMNQIAKQTLSNVQKSIGLRP